MRRDRAAIVKQLIGGNSRVVNSAFYTGQFGRMDDVKHYPYDMAAARKLLAEAGNTRPAEPLLAFIA